LMAMFFSMMHVGLFKTERGTNLLDTGAHFYDVYETKDGQYVSIGAIEPQFYAELIQKADLDPQIFGEQLNISKWPDYKEKLVQIFKTKTREEWCAVMEGSDVCFAPVLSIAEAPQHPHNQARGTFVTVNDVLQPAPAPRFSRTPTALSDRAKNEEPPTILTDYGFTEEEIRNLLGKGVVSGNK
jgi:alpha-methylacyl-CoA racemase